MDVRGATALVTGCNRGLGLAIAQALLARGAAEVIAAVRRPEAARAVFAHEPRVRVLSLDLADRASIDRAADEVPALDLLVNNAAILEVGDLLEADGLERLERELSVNVVGTAAVTRAFVPALARSPRRMVVHINSIAGLCPFDGVPSYAASKAAALSLTEGFRRELARREIPLLSVLPGPLETDMAAFLSVPKVDPAEVARVVLDEVEAGRGGVSFPDEGGKAFWASLCRDPRSVLFLP